jgi:hypothetical protein
MEQAENLRRADQRSGVWSGREELNIYQHLSAISNFHALNLLVHWIVFTTG